MIKVYKDWKPNKILSYTVADCDISVNNKLGKMIVKEVKQKYDFDYWIFELWQLNYSKRKDNSNEAFATLKKIWRQVPFTDLVNRVTRLRAEY